MNRPELFERTVDTLYKAYQDNHLIHVSSCGCAVGNMVCASMELDRFKGVRLPEANKYKPEMDVMFRANSFARNFSEERVNWWPQVYSERYGLAGGVDAMSMVKGMDEIKSTGYTREELNRIEHAFENAGRMDDTMSVHDKARLDPDGLLGLLNVVRVLGEIHGAEELSPCLMEAIATGGYKYCSKDFEDLNDNL